MTNQMKIEDTEKEIIDEFSMFDDWMGKYEHIIEMGKSLPMINGIYLKFAKKEVSFHDSDNWFLNFLRKAIHELSVPDIGIFFIGPYIKTAMKIIKQHEIKNGCYYRQRLHRY